jgi:anti-sigma factor RsiW
MACPDEDSFARFVEGLLGPADAAAIERHVDGCARCADLTAEFGRLYAKEPPGPRAAPGPSPTAALTLSIAIHVAATVLLWRAPGALAQILPSAPAAAALRYASFWAPGGALVAATAAIGLAGGWGWGRLVAGVYAAISLPSIVLTPLALYILSGLRGRDVPPRAAS